MLFRLSALWLLPVLLARAEPLPEAFADALKTFRADGAKGWAFTQTSTSREQSLVEAFDPMKPEMSRWTLLQKDGRAPTEEELKEYREKQTRRTRGDTAPDVTQQLDLASAEQVGDDAERSAYRFKLKSGGSDDTSAAYMRSTFTFHKPTRTIEKVELFNTEPFSPMLTVKIQEASTVIVYSLPEDDRPSLLDRIVVRVRGRAMFFKSLDEDLTVVYSDFRYAAKKPAAPAAP